MQRIQLANDLSFSRVIHGEMRSLEWGMSVDDYQGFIEQLLARGITTIDHADIYGGFEGEAFLGKVFAQAPSLRDQLEIVTKCGIQYPNPQYPTTYTTHYNYEYEYIIQQAERSLTTLQIETLDVLLLHRPSPLMDAQAIAKAFVDLKAAGKVRHFGVSNFYQDHFNLIQAAIDQPLVTNQIEVSAVCHEHIDNGNLDFLQCKQVAPMIWSPLAGGRIFQPQSAADIRTKQAIEEIATDLGVSVDAVLYAWLYKMPNNLMPIVGSGKLERIDVAIDALELTLTVQQWFTILQAQMGHSIK
ncbi:MAG: aldo/keto reductase [Culicoidibacterales bacterium]